MNRNYKEKKRVVIMVLSILAVCLAAVLIWYTGTMGKTEPPVMEPEMSETEPIPTVPRIDTGSIMQTEKESGSEQVTEETGEEAGASPAQESSEEEVPELSEDLPVREDGNPRTPKEAVPPSETPAEDEPVAEVEDPDGDGNCQPEHMPPEEDLPKGGEVSPEGAVYVPGFGYVESSGSNEQGISSTDGDWNRQIGTMQ